MALENQYIAELPVASSVSDGSLFVAEQSGVSVKVTGAQIKGFAQNAINNLTATAQSVGPDAAANVQKTVAGGIIQLKFSIPKGKDGKDGTDGKSLDVKDQFDTLAALQAAHPTGNAGDAYIVGTGENSAVYLWSASSGEWENVGGLQGPGVPTGGTAGQVLAKNTATDYDTHWIDPPGGGGGGVPDGMYAVRVQASNPDYGSVFGGGLVFDGVSVTVQAEPSEGYMFDNWQESGVQVSEEASYTFKVTEDRTLVAAFKDSLAGFDWSTIWMPSHAIWNSITYGGGKFAAVARRSNKAAYSTDGINWTAATLPASKDWYSVTYGDGKFVAVADDDNAAYSTDGITWTATTMPSSNDPKDWRSVTYGDGKFVAVAYNSDVAAYSTDGINWTAATMPAFSSGFPGSWHSVAYGNGKFVATTYANKKDFAYSSDGINWTYGEMPASAYWGAITYGNGRFVAVTIDSGSVAAYSTDGINWTAATNPFSANCTSIGYGNGRFVTVSFQSDVATYSTDGINWTAATMSFSTQWNSVAYGDGKFVAVGESVNAAYISDGSSQTNGTAG